MGKQRIVLAEDGIAYLSTGSRPSDRPVATWQRGTSRFGRICWNATLYGATSPDGRIQCSTASGLRRWLLDKTTRAPTPAQPGTDSERSKG